MEQLTEREKMLIKGILGKEGLKKAQKAQKANLLEYPILMDELKELQELIIKITKL